ncbi:hypothetical protein JAAARDRAFT_136971 [Jaapia argillacea MUCL 33604]|uniref:Ornithine decarboxylase antizyme n=1 Tax=Jaapia argillacea MUCL 33604 TaxID=933084 RepID=A0A067PF51_9AGAM|nr:hypothetical protein JAAARDRAFT_136971 [Jaapia argillacea MUCL 33604]
MSNITMLNSPNQQFSLCPTYVSLRPSYSFSNGRQAVGDGALSFDATPSVLAVCHMQGTDDLYYYSTTFSGGPGVRSSDWVRDSPARIFSASPFSDHSSSDSSSSIHEPDFFAKSIVYPPTPPADDIHTSLGSVSYTPPASLVAPQAIRPRQIPTAEYLATPPLTPDEAEEGNGSVAAISAKQSNSALDFLTTLFPRNGLSALPYAKSVSISAPDLGASFDGVVLELPGKAKTFYVDGKSADHINLRESIVALLDLADERLECSALVIALERSSPALSSLIHSMMYVGGTVVTKPPFQVDPTYVLVGLEI